MRIALLVAACLFIVIVLAIARRSSPTYPVSDDAVIELATLNALHGRQLLGPYSRYSWHHPGPALFYLLAPFYRASQLRAAGLAAGALALNVAVLAATLWALWRGGGPSILIGFCVAGGLYVWRLSEMLVSPWNAHVAVLAAAGTAVAAAGVAAGSSAAIPVFVVLASFALQTHIATLPLVLAAAGVALAGSVRSGRPGGRVIGAAFVCVALLWAVPLVEQLASPGGNISDMWRFVTAPSAKPEVAIGVEAWADSLTALFAPSFIPPRGALLIHDGVGWRGAAAILELGLLAGVAAWSWRTGHRFHLWLAMELIAASAAGLLALSRIPDGIHDHEVFWLSTVGLLTTALVLSIPAASAEGRGIRAAAMVAAVLFVGGISVEGIRRLEALVARSHQMRHDDRRTEQATRAVRNEIASTGARRPTVLIDQNVWETAAGVILQLRKEGIAVAVEPGLERMLSGTIAADGTEDLEVTFCGGPCHERSMARPNNRVLLFGDGLAIDAIRLR